MPARLVLAASLVLLAAVPRIGRADEGQWPPDQLARLDWAALRERGMELAPADIWDPSGRGLAQAIVSLEDCSASFVSPNGLILTNHHCAFGAIQQHSTKDRDLLADGFSATSRAAELPAKGQRVLVLRRITDVTERVTAQGAAATGDEARARALDRVQKEIIAECETTPATRCRVASYFGGLRYVLLDSLELHDVRLVYAPPRGIGEFGGEADNWRWPRHTGDFAFLRAYVAPDGSPAEYASGNVPYRPARHLTLSTEGVAAGDLVTIFGYPGRTARWGVAASVQCDLEWFYPLRRSYFGELKSTLEQVAAQDAEAAVRVSATIETTANRVTNAEAMIAGLRRNDVLAQRRARDAQLAAWIGADDRRRARYGTVLPDLAALVAADAATRDRDFLLGQLPFAVKPLGAALTLVRWSAEREKPEFERESGYQDRDRQRVRASLERMQKDLHPLADRAVFEWFLERTRALPPAQRITAFDEALRTHRTSAAVVADALARTRLTTAPGRLELFDAPRARIETSHDPLIVLARALEPQRREMDRRAKVRAGASARLWPVYAEALRAWRGDGALYPDANGALRVAFGTVKGYQPRDGLVALPHTTVDGLVAKHTGERPFDAPERLRSAVARRDFGRFAPQHLGSVPVAFLTDGDTTGGVSGGPVVDGKGRLVGVNFDRVWENVAGDYGWTERYSRNIAVDIRFVLWVLERVDGATGLLKELGVEPGRDSERRNDSSVKPEQ